MKWSHMLPFSLLLVPIVWGVYGFFKTRKEIRPVGESNKSYGYWPVVINSAVLYALAFNIIFFIQELFLALGKRWLGLKATLYHNNHNWEGNHPMERLAQGYGAAAIFITGIICYFIARRMRSSKGWGQLFFLWMAFEGMAQSLPQFITAKMAADTDTGQAFTYLGISDGLGVVITIAGILLMLFTGIRYSKYLLHLAPSISDIRYPSGRFRYLFKIAVLASLIGIVIIIPFRIMPWDRAMAPVFVTMLSIPMVFANAWNAKPGLPIDNEVNKKIIILPVILLIVLLLIFQLVLAPGVKM